LIIFKTGSLKKEDGNKSNNKLSIKNNDNAISSNCNKINFSKGFNIADSGNHNVFINLHQTEYNGYSSENKIISNNLWNDIIFDTDRIISSHFTKNTNSSIIVDYSGNYLITSNMAYCTAEKNRTSYELGRVALQMGIWIYLNNVCTLISGSLCYSSGNEYGAATTFAILYLQKNTEIRIKCQKIHGPNYILISDGCSLSIVNKKL
jgi:hypothetical protein